ncbi:AfsR/SARP family transcriptional regulator [Streptomyces monomycini]|uniref:AfsR/SARP family transcriptional regulator n=1 Tax=Streptomyces monomycini TaxID=371720 RepID=UPI0005185214|nr:BTAD domain-containing putative transcriptional regulator [Streptomyces monomycini]
MEIFILGPICLGSATHRVGLGSDKERGVLASLALSAGRPVALDALIDRLWDGTPPGKARESVHTYVSRIRKSIRVAAAVSGGTESAAIKHHAHTYTLEILPERIDWHRFQDLVSRARRLSDDGCGGEAVALLHQADDLWRGDPLAGLPGSWAERMRTSLTEQRLSATTSRIAMQLRLGRFSEVIGVLSSLAGQFPDDETLLGYHMLACYGCGRHADALRIYQEARRKLRAELGCDPSEELARIHQRILRRVPAREVLFDGPPHAPDTFRTAYAPRNLPRQAALVGRRTEMRRFHAVIAAASRTEGDGYASIVALEAISGMAGVGKTALAVNAASALGRHFPDGQLYIDLRTHARVQEPMSASIALATLLRLLGVPASCIPSALEERTDLWRTLLSHKRAVIILDDAADTDQVRPLLPGLSPSLIIITSRRHLAGLPGAHSLALDVLPPQDAIALFRAFSGQERTQDTTGLSRIVSLCGHLPLAIEIAANRFNARPSWSLADLRERLTRGPGRLTELYDGYSEVARAFEMSYLTLTPAQQSAFRRLALHLGAEFGPHAASALMGLPQQQTERLLESLLYCHLLQEPRPDRYRFHDLLGEYARALAHSEDDEETRDQAVRRLTDYYLSASETADALVYPQRPRVTRQRADGTTGTVGSRLAWRDAEAAKEWLTTERSNLLTVERHARTHGVPRQAALLSHALAGFLDAECHWVDTDRMQRHAVDHWKQAGDQRALCLALLDLSATRTNTGHYPEAMAAARHALELARITHAPDAEADALRKLGILHWNHGRNHEALAAHREAIAVHVRSGNTWSQARCENNYAISLLHLGEPREALEYFTRAIDTFQQAGDRRNSAKCINNLGDLHLQVGNVELARQTYETSLALTMDVGSLSDVATVQANLAGLLSTSADRHDVASGMDMFRECLFTFRRLGDRKNEGNALIGLGTAHFGLGQFTEAAIHHQQALNLARSIGAAQEEARALRCLGSAEAALGSLAAAAENLRAAISLARRIHFPEEAARATDVLAEVRLREGSRDAAQTLWRQAFELFSGLDKAEASRVARRLGQNTSNN